MKLSHNGLWFLVLFLSLFAGGPAHASTMCSWLGIGCAQTGGDDAPDDVFSMDVDQDNPPEVFAFTVSGSFEQWTDIPPETFICDTREREDRACVWQGHISEIKRNATVVFEPFAHDRGMYKVRAFIDSNLGRDPNYSANIGVSQHYETSQTGAIEVLASIREGISITHLSQNPLKAIFFEGNRYTVNKNNDPVGHVTVTFKGVLK